MGDDVVFRTGVLFSVALTVAACANDKPLTASFSSTGAVGMSTAEAGTYEAQPMPKKTMNDRVLTAIALERVTGLKPDPSRFAQ